MIRLQSASGSSTLMGNTKIEKEGSRMTRAVILFLALLVWNPARAQTQSRSSLELNQGDTLVFLGDSITHQCLYTQYVEDYFYTRYPDRRVHFHNAGVSGDRCADAIIRFDADVAAYKPKYVTILLGMNDGGYQSFHQKTFDTYEKDVLAVVERIRGAGANPILMTPTMFDSNAARARSKDNESRNRYYNATLAYYGALLRELAFTANYGFVDMYGPLNQLTIRQRRVDPKFTFITDAVHPDAPGQVVMAVAILADVDASRLVSSIEIAIDAAGYPQVAAQNGKLIGIEFDGRKLGFSFHSAALPWVLPKEAEPGFRLTRAGHRLTRETIRVVGLNPGSYALTIDGRIVGAYSHSDLAKGVELQENQQTPQYRQALAVAMLNKERNEKAVRPLRDLWLAKKLHRVVEARVKTAPNDKKAAAQVEQLAGKLKSFNAQVAELQAQAKGFADRIYASNRPKEHRYELLPTP
jgi:lysophospholipase L1-like esterase